MKLLIAKKLVSYVSPLLNISLKKSLCVSTDGIRVVQARMQNEKHRYSVVQNNNHYQVGFSGRFSCYRKIECFVSSASEQLGELCSYG